MTTHSTARTRHKMKGPDRGENADNLDTARASQEPSSRRKVVAPQRISGSGSPGARTPNLRIKSPRNRSPIVRKVRITNASRLTQTAPDTPRQVRLGLTLGLSTGSPMRSTLPRSAARRDIEAHVRRGGRSARAVPSRGRTPLRVRRALTPSFNAEGLVVTQLGRSPHLGFRPSITLQISTSTSDGRQALPPCSP
jgi:hypothetical protein